MPFGAVGDIVCRISHRTSIFSCLQGELGQIHLGRAESSPMGVLD
jgi:hypothetical protein